MNIPSNRFSFSRPKPSAQQANPPATKSLPIANKKATPDLRPMPELTDSDFQDETEGSSLFGPIAKKVSTPNEAGVEQQQVNFSPSAAPAPELLDVGISAHPAKKFSFANHINADDDIDLARPARESSDMDDEDEQIQNTELDNRAGTRAGTGQDELFHGNTDNSNASCAPIREGVNAPASATAQNGAMVSETFGRIICGVPTAAFEGSDPEIPLGSHYPAWVWKSLDKPGHVTIEIYVDAGEASSQSLLEKAYANKNTSKGPGNPIFSAESHVLISIPEDKSMPFLDSKRVLLAPVSRKALPAEKIKWKPPQQGAPNKSANEAKPVVVEYALDASGVSEFLSDNHHHNAIFGRIALQDVNPQELPAFWMMLAKTDAQRIEKVIYGDPPIFSNDQGARFGREGIDVFNDARFEGPRGDAKRIVESKPFDDRVPAPPALRYLGHWSNGQSSELLQLARDKAGPIMPSDWTREEENIVRAEHATIKRNAEREIKKSSSPQAPAQKTAAPDLLARANEKTASANRAVAQKPLKFKMR